MVTCTALGGPLDGSEFDDPDPPRVYIDQQGEHLYVRDYDTSDPVVYRFVTRGRVTADPIPVGRVLQASTLDELADACATLRAFGWGDDAPLRATATTRGVLRSLRSPSPGR